MRGHNDEELLRVMNDEFRYSLYRACILRYNEEQKSLNEAMKRK